jgi:hypothetical protein
MYIRLNGEFTQYEFTYVSATSATIQPTVGSTLGYMGATALSGVSFQITMDRIALPANFRTIESVQIDYTPSYLQTRTRDEINFYRKFSREVSYPRFYATDTDKSLTGAANTDYLWIYPAANAQYPLQLFYYANPSLCTLDADEFGVGNQTLQYDHESVLRMFIMARILQEQGDPNWQARFAEANKAADDLIGDRTDGKSKQRNLWNLYADGNMNIPQSPWGWNLAGNDVVQP